MIASASRRGTSRASRSVERWATAPPALAASTQFHQGEFAIFGRHGQSGHDVRKWRDSRLWSGYIALMKIDTETCYRALAARDARFDGLFFVGVTTTRIYCRPICTARTPRSDRCRFFANAAAAEHAGFRPCLRCRPELAPGHAPVDALGRTARQAAARIEAGALNDDGSLETLARELGLSSRQLRRAIRREFGISPVELAQTRRLLLAKQLLTETNLPMIEVALSSGFASVRRFNALFRSHYSMTPSRIRRTAGVHSARDSLTLTLAYRPPLAWKPILQFLAGRATMGVESVLEDRYLRTVRMGEPRGWVKVEPSARRNALSVEISTSLAAVLLSPRPERLAEAEAGELVTLGIAAPRARAIGALARAVVDRRIDLVPGADPDLTIERLLELPGIGDWTAHYVAMRALRWPDAFPAADLGLLKATLEIPCGALSLERSLSLPGAFHSWTRPCSIASSPARSVSCC